MSEWQDIATAKKSRRNILVLMAGKATVGWWDEDEYAKHPKPTWRSERGYLFGKTWEKNNQPTHWRPLPPPPEDTTKLPSGEGIPT